MAERKSGMRILENLEPQNVFYYFEEICKIPHGSGHTRQISDYLKAFADEHGLYCRQDELNNIIMIKEASKGYEDHEPVLLQGHMDMVAVKDADCTIDMTKDGLQLEILGDRLTAKGTSLGGDDGIAVAFGLALLAEDQYRHPRIELILTVDEEVGMEGATGLTVDDLTAKRMINLDQEEEEIFITGCAGGARIDIRKKTETEQVKGMLCKLKISGLQGGHSGQEIDKERGNAICLMGRLLAALQEKTPVYLKEVSGGTADNAIPNEVCAEIVVTEWTEDIAAFMEEKFCGLKAEFAGKEDGLKCELQVGAEDALIEVCNRKDSEQWIHLLNVIPHGVIANSVKMKGLVETSLNPGILNVSAVEGMVSTSVRSSNAAAKEALINQLKSLAALCDATVGIRGDYPGWDYDPDSPLREKMVSIYEEMYGVKPQIEAIHAGLECGIFQSKILGLDCVSIGPDMQDIHTTRETLSIPSVQRVWKFLLKVLESL
ncbi:MAG: aminoacyl-histidine dipeptidase [Lachnospiraceae bacterium]|nr:aminoacyl-histidine dipeptidase [Lachnospiraceae bacterium]